jgi:hypothetical protein
MRRADQLRANVTAYDSAYVALAEALECELLTADQRFANAPGPGAPYAYCDDDAASCWTAALRRFLEQQPSRP